MSTLEYRLGDTHYADRKVRAALHVRGCRRSTGPICGGAFKCARCGKLVGWCRGGSHGDVRDDWCDVCFDKPTPPSFTETEPK